MRQADKNLKTYLEVNLEMMNQMNVGIPEGYSYSSQYDFMLKHGKFYEPNELDSNEKQIIKKALKRIGFKPQKKECFYNAQMLSLSDNTGKIKYCEGFALKIIPTNHAWIELNGKVIDVTWADKEDNNFFGMFPEDVSYCGFNMDKNYTKPALLVVSWMIIMINTNY